MTEAEWLASADPAAMLQALADGASDRKLRLYGCAWSRRLWASLAEDCFRAAVDVAERFAEGAASAHELAAARKASGAALERSGLSGVCGPAYCALGCAWSTTRMPAWTAAVYPLGVFTSAAERSAQVALVRELFGDAYRPAAVEAEWLTEGVVRLARSIYEQRAFEHMPDLARALADAGCKDRELLEHCAGPAEHARGCWALDALLGRN
jgi:hypothetical protein